MSFYVKEENGRDHFYVRYSQRIRDQPTAKCQQCGIVSLKKDLIECSDTLSWRNIFLHKVCYEPYTAMTLDSDDEDEEQKERNEANGRISWEEYRMSFNPPLGMVIPKNCKPTKKELEIIREYEKKEEKYRKEAAKKLEYKKK